MSSESAGPDAQFRVFLSEGRFMLQRGVETGVYVFYPRIGVPGTGEALEWVEASGRGIVYSTTVVRVKPPAPSYNIALIDLAEGPRMMSRVEGIEAGAVSIGMTVRAQIISTENGPLIVFSPEAAS